MKLYDDVIKNINHLIETNNLKRLNKSSSWPQGNEDDLIFKNDTALELGENATSGLSGIIFTSNQELVKQDEIILIGDDISSLKEPFNYARIVLVRLKDEVKDDNTKLFSLLRKIDYIRYHVFPEGCNLRISPFKNKESLRISKQAFKNKINFAALGSLFIDAYHENENVEAVKIIFITEPLFNYNELLKILQKNENITQALDHLTNKVNMDCHACSLQKVCNEVETLINKEK